jgi:hypothetical protein
MSLPATQDAPDARRKELESRVKTGSSWLWSVVGFSVLNSILLRVGSQWGFCVGLFVAQINDYGSMQYVRNAGPGTHTGITVAAYVIDALLIGGFALVARMCDRRRRWWLLPGLVFYALDTALTGWAQVWPSLIYHAITLTYGFRAFSAIGALQRLPLGEPAVASPVAAVEEPETVVPLDTSRRFAGWPAAIVGLVVVGVVLVLVIYVCQEADQFVANR